MDLFSKKSNKIVNVFIGIFLIFWFVGILLSPIIGGGSFFLPLIGFIGIVSIELGCLGYQIFSFLFSCRRWYTTITAILLLLFVLLIIGGILILLPQVSIKNVNEVEKLKVIKVKNNSVTVDSSKFNHGDKAEKTIYKPFFVKTKEGEIISVGYSKNIDLMYYVFDSLIGEKMISIGYSGFVFMILFWMIILFIYIPFYIYKSKEK